MTAIGPTAGASYHDLQWVPTGERLTAETLASIANRAAR